ncbi:TorF family putative porin [Methylopila sp. 73B]|uniref:TorF family putative porin n=1 Tax=Methylopila sp. 73B TaxID=1120792 RepID=UPI000466CA2B|nr:TorF family putative porin [Methylopila sp. 73B]
MSYAMKLACAALVGAAALPLSDAAMAADLAAPEAFVVETMSPIDVSFGVKFATEYNLRSVSQSKGDPAVQGYVEVSAFDWVYAGFWASNVNFGGADPTAELDYYGGVRHTFDALTLDAGFLYIDYVGQINGTRSLDFWKIYGIAKYAVTADFSVGANVYWTSDFVNIGDDSTHSSLFAKYSIPSSLMPIPDVGAYVSAEVGKFWIKSPIIPDYTFWNAGVGFTYKAMTLDLRYTDSNLSRRECATFIGQFNSCGDRYMASLSFDTSFSKLK